ncbi:MAG: inhibitor of KinA [Verrucomicrobiota bacterium]|jgi:inhibitor of KinA
MRIEPLGDSALIVRVEDEFRAETSLNAVLAALRSLERAAIPGVIELAPAYTTIGVFFDPARIEPAGPDDSPFETLGTKIQSILDASAFEKRSEIEPPLHEIPVCYHGEFAFDLAEVAQRAGLTEAEVVRRYGEAVYRVTCVGFTPGFPYLSGLPAELATPRRVTPRKEIAAGSVAIGGAQTGIYSVKSPGGWNVIGRTPLRLFDMQRERPALLRTGDTVRFRGISREEFESLAR